MKWIKADDVEKKIVELYKEGLPPDDISVEPGINKTPDEIVDILFKNNIITQEAVDEWNEGNKQVEAPDYEALDFSYLKTEDLHRYMELVDEMANIVQRDDFMSEEVYNAIGEEIEKRKDGPYDPDELPLPGEMQRNK